MTITKERWSEAQIAERKAHDELSIDWGAEGWGKFYSGYFKYLDINASDLQSKKILEIGPGDYPALWYCKYYSWGYIIEPMPSPTLWALVAPFKIIVFQQPAEEIKNFPAVDEVWLFNVLQHVIDPDIIIAKAKAAAQTIRFFEPINYPTNVCHPHTFDMQYFINHFGDAAKHYPADPTQAYFHQSESAYGVWEKK